MSSGWAFAASAVKAASPYPRENSSAAATYPDVRWEIGTLASQRISGLDPWGSTATAYTTAMSIPAFAQGVHVIAGQSGAMPLWAHRGTYARTPAPNIITRPDPDVPSSVVWTRLYQDLVLHPYGWMLVTERLASGFPYRARHVPFNDVTVAADGVYVDGRRVDDRDVLRFDSPFAPGALTNGARILSLALAVETAVRRFATFDIPSGVLKQTGGPDLLDNEVDDLLGAWESARQQRSTAFLSSSLTYEQNAFDARQLQLVEARAAITADIARLLNLPPSAVNAETGSSLTYSTVAMQADALQSQTLWPYLSAVRERLSMDDVTPHGTTIEIPSLGFMRTDLSARANAYQTMIGTGVLTVDEARGLEQLPPLDSTVGSSVQSEAPARVSQQVYLAVANGVLSVPEARQLIADAGADIDPLADPATATPVPDDPAPDNETQVLP